MCGRYTLSVPGDVLAELFDLEGVPDLSPRYNIAPTQEAAVVRRSGEGTNRLGELRWGLVPFWADDPSIGNRLVNARAETAHEKPSFREPFRRRRCLVPADGFYEWKARRGKKLPYHIRPVEGEVLPLAGLWDRWSAPGGETRETFTILTRDASPEELAAIHPRMPVVLGDSALWDLWLAPDADPEELRELILEIPSPDFTIVPVSTRVNRVENDDPGVLEPRPEEPETDTPDTPDTPDTSGTPDDTEAADPRRGEQQTLF